MTVGDHEVDTGRTAFARVTQEGSTEVLGLAVADHHAEDLAATVLGDAGRDDDGLGDDPVIDRALTEVAYDGLGDDPVIDRALTEVASRIR
ncbi:hypothetical protein ADK75_07385 [Streptomyces virginiae]|uniref:Uncharacterized protein n=1 Tax=Streptomyces virginiae TaxID=1961 RepID=A0A0L8N1F6_STRVG|nr:hypothetical protein ADK75_07385 [Streptomyces virginiae]